MKANVIQIESRTAAKISNSDTEGLIIEAESVKIKEGCYYFYDVDITNPILPTEKMVAIFPISKFYILGNKTL